MKNPCACRTRPAPPHMPQVFGLVPALAPMPEQDFAGDRDRNFDLGGLALEGFLQGDFHIVAQVRATLAAATAALARHAEQVFENIREGGSKAGAEARAAAAALLEGGMAEPVIGGALVAVLEDLVGLVDFLETDFAGGIARILVRMPFHRELAKGRLESGFVRVAFDFKGLVITALGGHPSNPPDPQSLGNAAHNAAFGLTKNNPHSFETPFRALARMGVMTRCLKQISCCSCRRRLR